ncbi:MAG: DM13 domain-containing protein [Pseudomonadota bacterium]
MKKATLLFLSHLLFALGGFALGIYALPILTAPAGPSATAVADVMQSARFTGTFRRDLEGSDFLHWGDGTLSISETSIALEGSVSPGPDYKLYLSPAFVETEAAFEALKPEMVQVADIKTFDNFLVGVPEGIDPAAYNTVVVWCESFGEFISAAQYQ